MNRWSALALLLAIAGALALRTHDLGNRPLHNDEAVNATKLATLWDKGEYKYDPHEYHGPTLHYFSLPVLKLSSAINSDGRARHSVRAGLGQTEEGAHGVTRPTQHIGKSVAGLLAGIVLVDWAAVPRMADEFNLVFVGLFVLALIFQRKIPAT